MMSKSEELEELALLRTQELVYLRSEVRRLRDLETWYTSGCPLFDHDYLVWAHDEYLGVEPLFAVGEWRNSKWMVPGLSHRAEVLAWANLIAPPYDLTVAAWHKKQAIAQGKPPRYIWQVAYTPPGKQQPEVVYGTAYWHDDGLMAAMETVKSLKPHEWQSVSVEVHAITHS